MQSGASPAYVMSMRELKAIMALINRIVDVRITFFDHAHSIRDLEIKDVSAYCARRRRSREFNQRCERCDREHLELAKQQKDVHIYYCHEGLIEGIVPLYNRREVYLGAIVFGQLRDPARKQIPAMPAGCRRLHQQLQTCTLLRARDIGYLLKYVSEYIIENELIRHRSKGWVEVLDTYITENPAHRFKLAELAARIGCSTSFVSHHFKEEFGHSPSGYVLRRKMGIARRMLEEGRSVKETAGALGFYDAFHFSKRFKSFWGSSPSSVLRP